MEQRIGQYLLGRELGRGGMGVVWEARHATLGQAVAIKLISDPLMSDGLRARFLREARACAGLRHPGVVRVLDAGEERGRPYLVMDLLEGESLAARLQRGPLAPAQAVAIASAVAEALEHVHEHGLLHRDLKPDNVLLGAGGPVLIDFGLARDAHVEHERLTRTGELLGTPEFMAPEQADGQPERVDQRSDVYGLGATLYALLAGGAPFKGRSALEVLRKVLADPPPPLKVDPGLEAIVRRCLEKDPAARYPRAADLRRDLSAWSAAQLRPRRAGLGGAAALSGAILAAGAGGVLVVTLARRGPAPALAEAVAPPPPSSAALDSAAARGAPQAERLTAVEGLLRRRAWSELDAATRALLVEAPTEARVWRLRGEALLGWNTLRPLVDLREAERALREAQRLDPQNADVLGLLAACRRAQGDPGWITDAEEALRRGRTSSGLAWMAEVLRLMSELPAGRETPPSAQLTARLREAREKALALAPGSMQVCWVTGEVGLELLIRGVAGEREALEGWQRGLLLDPQDPYCLTQLGFTWKTLAEQEGTPLGEAAETALATWDRSIESDPEYWYTWLQRGYLRLVREEHGLAIPDLERASALNPAHDLPAWLLVAACQRVQDRDGALAALKECLRRNPHHPEANAALSRLGPQVRQALEASGRVSGRELLAAMPDLLATRAWVAVELGAARLVRELPDAAQAWYWRAETHLRRQLYRQVGDPAWAVAALEEACRLDPGAANARGLLALCRARGGDREAAAREATRALELDPTCALAWAARVRLLGASPGPDRRSWETELREACRQALATGRDSPWTWYEVGGAVKKVGDAREAHEHFAAAVGALPDDPYFLTAAGFALKDLGQASGDPRALEEACGWYDRAIAADPRYGNAYLERGWARHLLGRPPQEALPDLRRAQQLLPRNAHTSYVLGLVSKAHGERDEARAALRECLRRDPSHAQAAALLAELGD